MLKQFCFIFVCTLSLNFCALPMEQNISPFNSALDEQVQSRGLPRVAALAPHHFNELVEKRTGNTKHRDPTDLGQTTPRKRIDYVDPEECVSDYDEESEPSMLVNLLLYRSLLKKLKSSNELRFTLHSIYSLIETFTTKNKSNSSDIPNQLLKIIRALAITPEIGEPSRQKLSFIQTLGAQAIESDMLTVLTRMNEFLEAYLAESCEATPAVATMQEGE